MGVQQGFLPAEGQGAQVGSRAAQVSTSVGPFCVWPHLCLGSLAHVILANLGCQLDRIWDQLKNASGLFILKDLLLKGEDPSPELVASSGHSPDTKREKQGSFPSCLYLLRVSVAGTVKTQLLQVYSMD